LIANKGARKTKSEREYTKERGKDTEEVIKKLKNISFQSQNTADAIARFQQS